LSFEKKKEGKRNQNERLVKNLVCHNFIVVEREKLAIAALLLPHSEVVQVVMTAK